MSGLDRDGRVIITFKGGRPNITIMGDVNGRMIKALPRHLMAAYRKHRLTQQRALEKPEVKTKED